MSAISRKDAAEKIKLSLESDTREKFDAKVWASDGKVRVYVRDLGYTNAQDRGFIAVLKNGDLESHLERNSRYAFEVAKDAIKGIQIIEAEVSDSAKLTPEERAVRNLNSRFGEGNWDQRDFEDEVEREEYQ